VRNSGGLALSRLSNFLLWRLELCRQSVDFCNKLQKISSIILHAPRRPLKTAESRSNPTMSTTIPSGKDIKRKWFVLDASGKTLGRLATHAASVLAGKLNPLYTPYIDMGDHVVIINAEKIVLTGLKADQKLYRRYTGFPGGLREESFVKLLARRPEAIVEQAVKGMLPKSKMGRQMATKLKVYKGSQHPHLAQQPQPMEIVS
jgi:large subunit ribosomal protein L13